MKLSFILVALALAACSQSTPLTAARACEAQRVTFEQYAECARANLGSGTQNDAYRDFLAYAVGEIRAGRATDAQAFYTDAYLKQLVASNLAQQEFWQNERRAATLQSMGQQMVTMGAPQPRLSVTCNTFGYQTTCY